MAAKTRLLNDILRDTFLHKALLCDYFSQANCIFVAVVFHSNAPDDKFA